MTATGLARASLYGAFGDEEQLFQRVVKHYLEQSDREVAEATRDLSARQPLKPSLTAAFKASATRVSSRVALR